MIISFAKFIIESPVIVGDYNLEHKFDHYNSLLFEGRIPKCPINWTVIKGAGGMTYYRQQREQGRTSMIPGSLRIELSTKFKRTEQGIDEILIHEMIHAYLATTTGDGDGKHGLRFQSWVYRLSEKVGFQIPRTDNIEQLELTTDEKKMTTVVLWKERGDEWFANYYSGTAFDSPEKMDQLIAYWGAPGKLKSDQEILVFKVETNLGTKYGMSNAIRQKNWYKIQPNEEHDVRQYGHIIQHILPNSLSHEDAISKMPSKDTLVVLQTNKMRGTVYATFYFPNIVQDPVRMARLIAKWKGYYRPGVVEIEIFTTKTVIFNRGMSMTRDETKGAYYILKPDSVSELRRNAKYIERWV